MVADISFHDDRTKSCRLTPADLVRESLGAVGCRRWMAIIGMLDGFVDAQMMLTFSMVCKKLHSLRWRLENQSPGCAIGFPPSLGRSVSGDMSPKMDFSSGPRTETTPAGGRPRLVSFSGLRGFDPSDLMERYVRQVMTLIHPQVRSDGIVLDLSHCVLIKDSHLVHLLSEDSPFVPSPKVTASRTKLVGLKLDFCNLITDKGLTALLTAHLPHIRLLSLRCVRSEKLTGAPFTQALSPDLWPKLKYALVDFSSITLEACNAVVEMLVSRRLESTSPVSQEDMTKGPPWFSFMGSQASKSYMESIGARHLVARLNQALNSGNPSDLRSLKDAADTESLMTDYGPLAEYVSGRGGQYIMNLPVTSCTSEEGGVNVWTIPISLALLNGDPAFVETLVECGAEVDIVDHLGKSPLYRAVSAGNVEVCKYLLAHGVDITPLNITLPTPMNAAVMTKNITITRLLIEYGYPLNLRCPGFKAFKSPLHVAAELPNERLIHDLLDWGADPNCFSGSYKNSAIMLAYKAEPRLLRLFIHNLRFRSRPLAAEVLAAAIAKDDIRTVELIMDSFPVLLEREHPTWSYPHIQAAKTGKNAILEYLLRTFTVRLAGIDVKELQRNFPLCSKHCQEEIGTESMPTSSSGVLCEAVFPQSSPAKLSRHPSKGSIDISHPNGVSHPNGQPNTGAPTVGNAGRPDAHPAAPAAATGPGDIQLVRGNTKPKNRFWSKQSTAEAQSLKFLPMESDETALQHWNESIANSYNKNGVVPSRYATFLNAVDQNTGNTALHYAAEGGQLECAKLMLRYGCDVDVQNYALQSPLHLACHENELEIVEYLLCTGSDFLDLADANNETPLVTAIQTRNDRVALKIIKFWRMCRRQAIDLLARQPNDTIGDESPIRPGPLDVALEYGRYDVAYQLLRLHSLEAVLSQNYTRRLSSYNMALQSLQDSSCTPQARKIYKRFVVAYDSHFGVDGCSSEIVSDGEEQDDEEMSSDWYDLCLLCNHRVSAPGPTATSTEEHTESRARRFQSKLRLAAKKPLLLFSNRHRAGGVDG